MNLDYNKLLVLAVVNVEPRIGVMETTGCREGGTLHVILNVLIN